MKIFNAEKIKELDKLTIETQKIRPGHDKIIDHLVSILLIECIRDHVQQMTDQQNWLSWFTGKSRSTQFHFVDLLELLSRFAPVQKS